MSPRQSRRGFVKACAALPLLGAASSFHVHLCAAEAKQPFATDNEKINSPPRFLGGAGDVGAFLDHLDYAVKKFGADHVAIGPDISYVSRNDETERARIPKWSGLTVTRWEHLWPADNDQPQPHAERSLAWTNWPLFTVGLVQRGHSDETIRRVARANFAG
jgi:microsomal dipeptidase-like Zn-dependent dipeptidase